jgi:hypothetical protein
MYLQESKEKEFLIKFTKEIILHIKLELAYKESLRLEEERRRKAIELEKLKQRFSQYGEKKQEENKVVNAPTVQNYPKINIVQEKPKMYQAPKFQEIPKPIQKIQPPKFQPPKPTVQQAPTEKPLKLVPLQQKKVEPLVTNIKLPQELPPVQPGEIDLGRLVFLVKDNLITHIECPGEDKNVIIRRAGNLTQTQITLKKEEIIEIIKSFSQKAKIPLIEGMLNARVGNLEISAVVNENTSPSFIIRKIIIQVNSLEPTRLDRPMMQFPKSPNPINSSPMPIIARPFTSGAPLKPQENKNQSSNSK